MVSVPASSFIFIALPLVRDSSEPQMNTDKSWKGFDATKHPFQELMLGLESLHGRYPCSSVARLD
jgi:hypothetical protein